MNPTTNVTVTIDPNQVASPLTALSWDQLTLSSQFMVVATLLLLTGVFGYVVFFNWKSQPLVVKIFGCSFLALLLGVITYACFHLGG